MSRALVLALALALGCKDKSSPDSGTTAGEPYDCGTIAERPTLDADAWQAAGPVPAGGIISMVDDGTTVWAASHNAGLWRSVDGGDTWSWVQVQITHTLADLWVSPGVDDEIFRSSGGWLQYSQDGGNTWTYTDLGEIDPTQESNLVVALGGASWDADRIYAIDTKGHAWISTDHAATFTQAGATGGVADPEALAHLHYLNWRVLGGASADDAVLFTDTTGVWRSTDELQSWTNVLTAQVLGNTLQRSASDPDDLMVAGAGGLFTSDDGGATWSEHAVGVDVTAAAWLDDGATIAVAGSGQFMTSDDGETWTAVDLAVESPAAIHQLDDGRVLLAHDDGLVGSDDGGSTWFDADEGIDDPGMAVITTHPDCPDRLITASRCSGGLFTSDDWGQTWAHVDDHFHYVMSVHHAPSDPDQMWSVSDDAYYRSDDGGHSWTKIYSKYHFHGLALDPDDPEVGLIGSVGSGGWADDSGKVYRLTDGGYGFQESSTGIPQNDASMHDMHHWPGDADVVVLATYIGGDVSHFEGDGIGLYRSTDRGDSWSKVDGFTPTEVAMLEDVPDGMVAATGDGLWLSTDKGETWDRQDGPTGLLLAVDFVGGTGLTVSQDGGLWRSDDGGYTWTALDEGLPWDSSTYLAGIGVSADLSVGWVTVFGSGVYTISLE